MLPKALAHVQVAQMVRADAAGTYNEPGCMWKSYDLDHAVAVVGYGTDDAGVDFWIVKNSWSSHWCALQDLPACLHASVSSATYGTSLLNRGGGGRGGLIMHASTCAPAVVPDHHRMPWMRKPKCDICCAGATRATSTSRATTTHAG